MYHFDIPKTRQYDTGKIEVIARNSVGEAMARCELKVIPRSDDYRAVLKNSPRRKYPLIDTIFCNNFTYFLDNDLPVLNLIIFTTHNYYY